MAAYRTATLTPPSAPSTSTRCSRNSGSVTRRVFDLSVPDGYTAWCHRSDTRDGYVVLVEHTATGLRGRSEARKIAVAHAAALKACRVRQRAAARAVHPLRLVRDLDVTAAPGEPLVVPQSVIDAMLDATAPR